VCGINGNCSWHSARLELLTDGLGRRMLLIAVDPDALKEEFHKRGRDEGTLRLEDQM